MPPRTRLVRRAPLLERIKAYCDPFDFLLWLSEELNGNEWDDFQKQWATPAGLLLNFVLVVARANTGSTSRDADPDVFGDAHDWRGSGWLAWFASFVVHLLALLSFANAFFTFWRTRHYRLFETPIDQTPSTPSAHRVRVDSSPLASSPLRYLQNMLRTDSAESRSHARAGRDVWEIDVWDPSPLSLRLFCLFSPGHVMVYWLFLPLAPLDPRPSVTVVTTIFLAALLSAQMTLMQLFFTQKSKDSTIIHKEVQNEYDTKFVQPTINKPVRSAGTQCISNDTPKNTHEVLVSTPTTYVNRGFITNPNTNYLSHYDPEAANSPQAIQERLINRTVNTPNLRSLAMNSAADFSSPLRSTPGNVRQPQVGSTPQASNGGGGGNLGVHTHAQSPLKKGTGISSERHRLSTGSRPAGFRQLSPPKRPTSPLKRVSTPADSGQNGGLQNRFSHLRGGDKDRERRPY